MITLRNLSGVLVTRVLLEGKKAVGLEYLERGELKQVHRLTGSPLY